MSQLMIKTLDGTDTKKTFSLTKGFLDVAFNDVLVKQLVVAYQENARMGTKKNKNRSEVSGGGRKPKAQKGSGGARAGTIRSPIWVGGGVTFAAKPRDFYQKVNRKMYRAGLHIIFSRLLAEEKLHVVDAIDVSEIKTKFLKDKLASATLNQGRTMFIRSADQYSNNFELASRNIVGVSYMSVDAIDIAALIYAHNVVVTSEVLEVLQKRFLG